MKIALITGSAGLIGSESVRFLAERFDLLIGIDNDMRAYFFGPESSASAMPITAITALISAIRRH
jgi:CDP-paratose 2-epimerase